MKLYTFATPSHMVLFNSYLLPSAQNFQLICKTGPQTGKGVWGKRDFFDSVRGKSVAMLNAVAENMGDIILWCDADVQLFDLTPDAALVELGEAELAAQNDSGTLCSGLFIVQCNERTLSLFEKLATDDGGFGRKSWMADQAALNQHSRGLKTKLISTHKFWHVGCALGREWDGNLSTLRNVKVPPGILAHHANYCIGVPNKLRLLKFVADQCHRNRSENAPI